jgi:acyl-[acyl-carrier-protein]-phospholipid O-acyltransferase/long-chain-fatty-acid--[acyl-carrier-protein] ligase
MSANPRTGLLSGSFLGLLTTQLLTAVNDNVFRWLVIGIGKKLVEDGSGQEGSILAAGTACFVLPYLFLAATAGYLADRFSKRDVIVACKIGEIVIMSLGIYAIMTQSIVFLFVVVALMGAQSALFSPSKLGCIPEILPAEKISAANGLFGLTTVAATVVGMAIGNWLSDRWRQDPQANIALCAAVTIGLAMVGTGFSLLIHRLPAANAQRRFPFNTFAQTIRDLRLLASNKAMFRVALGIVFFWSIGSLAQMNIDQFAAESGARLEKDKIPLLFGLVLGVGVGSILAGILSRGRVELGILPLGAFGVAASSMLLFTVRPEIFGQEVVINANLVWSCFLLFSLGCGAGLFHIPLQSYLQHRSEAKQRGSILAASNFLTFSGILIFSGLFFVMRLPVGDNAEPLLATRSIFLVCGLMTVPVLVYILWLVPQASARFLVWLASLTIYRIKLVDSHHLPERGGALLVANHVTWLDGILLLMVSSRPVRMIAWGPHLQRRWLKRLVESWGAILIYPESESNARAFETARVALENGELVCIFPEGGLTQTGEMQSFRPEMMEILEGASAPAIPIFLDELWGSIFSFERGRFFWKWPRKIPYRISVYFGAPIDNPTDVDEVRDAIEALGPVTESS